MDRAAEEKGPPIGKPAPEILIIDDDQEFITDLLRFWRAPLATRIAQSGKEAIQYLRKRVPRMILLDLRLPHYLGPVDDLEGQTIVAYLKARPQLQCPIVIITQELSPEVRNRLLAMGVDAYLTKPIDVSELDGIVTNVLA
jgi:CheY-like chemotaxis protein